VYFASPWRSSPRNWVLPLGIKKLEWWNYQAEKEVWRYLQSCGYNPPTYRRTDRQQRPRLRIASRDRKRLPSPLYAHVYRPASNTVRNWRHIFVSKLLIIIYFILLIVIHVGLIKFTKCAMRKVNNSIWRVAIMFKLHNLILSRWTGFTRSMSAKLALVNLSVILFLFYFDIFGVRRCAYLNEFAIQQSWY